MSVHYVPSPRPHRSNENNVPKAGLDSIGKFFERDDAFRVRCAHSKIFGVSLE